MHFEMQFRRYVDISKVFQDVFREIFREVFRDVIQKVFQEHFGRLDA